MREGSVAADGGWRIYSSGPGLYVNLLLCHALGVRRRFGERIVAPVLPRRLGRVTLEMDLEAGAGDGTSEHVRTVEMPAAFIPLHGRGSG